MHPVNRFFANMSFSRLRRALLVCVAVLCATAGWATTYVYTAATLSEYTGAETEYAAIVADTSNTTASSDYTLTTGGEMIQSTDTIIFASDVSMTLGVATNSGTIVNYGTLSTDNFTNNGSIINYGHITFPNGVSSSGTIENYATIVAEGTITNNGTIANAGGATIDIQSAGTLRNTSTISNEGSISSPNGIDNSGTITNDGGTITGAGTGLGTVVTVDKHTYYWIGSNDGDWTDDGNWSHTEGGEPLTDETYPGIADGDTAVFTSAVLVNAFTVLDEHALTITNTANTVDDRITLASQAETDYSAPSKLTINGSVLFGDKLKTLHALIVSSLATAQFSTMDIQGTFENFGTVLAYGTLNVMGEMTNTGSFTGGRISSTNIDQTVTFFDSVKNNGTFTCLDGTVTFAGDFVAGADSSFIASSSATYFLADADFSAMTVAENFKHNDGSIYFYNMATDDSYITMKTPDAAVSYNKLYVGGNVELNTTNSFICSYFNMQAEGDDYQQTKDFVVKLTGNGMTATESQLYRCSSNDSDTVSGTLLVEAGLTFGNSLYMHSGTNLIVDESSTVSLSGATFTDTSSDAHANTVTVKEGSTLDATGVALAFDARSSLTNNGTVTAADITNASGNENTITNNGTMTLTGSLMGAHALTNNGTLTAAALSAVTIINGSTIKTGDLTAQDTTDAAAGTITSTGTVQFTSNGRLTIGDTEHSFLTDIIIDNGATLTLAQDITVRGDWTNNGVLNADGNKLTLLGTAGNPSAIGGNGQFVVAADKFSGDYLSIGAAVTIRETAGAVVPGAFNLQNSDGTCTSVPASSTTDDAYIAVYQNGWKLKAFSFVWQGTNTTSPNDWAVAENWKIGNVDGTLFSTDGLIPGDADKFTHDATVHIPDGCTDYPADMPVSYTVASLTIGTETNETHDATLLLAEKKLTVTTTLTNYGTIAYGGAGRVMNADVTPAVINDAAHDGTVAYSGAGQTVSAVDYANLVIFADDATVADGDITVGGDVTVQSGATLALGSGAFSVVGKTENNGAIVGSAGAITCGGAYGGSGAFTASRGKTRFADAVDLSACTNFNANDGEIVFIGTAQTLITANGQVFASITISSGTTLTLASDITVSGNWTNNGTLDAATNSATVSFTGDNKEISGNQTFYHAVFAGSGATLSGQNTFDTATFEASTTIADANTFTHFVCETAGVTLTFASGKTQTIAPDGSFTITGGADAGEEITLTASAGSDDDRNTWWYLDVAKPAVTVQHAVVSHAYARYSIASHVTDSAEGTEDTTFNWFESVFYWFGTESSDWATPANWAKKDNGTETPGRAPQMGTSETSIGKDKIVIVQDENDTDAHTLKIPQNIFVPKVTVETGKSLDVQGNNMYLDDSDSTTEDDFLLRDGATLLFSGTGQRIDGTAQYGNNVTFSYYGENECDAVTGTAIPDEIANLAVAAGTTVCLGAKNVTVTGTVTNDGTIEIDGEGVFDVTGTMDTDSGEVHYRSADVQAIPHTFGFYDLTVTAPVMMTCEGDVTIRNNVTLSDTAVMWNGALTVENDVTVTDSDFTMKAMGSVGGSLTATNTTITTDDALTVGGTLTFDGGALALNASSTATATAVGSCEFNSGSISFGNGAGDSFTALSGEILFPAALTVSVAGTITAGTAIRSEKETIALTADTVFASPFVLQTDVTVGTGNTITFNGELQGAHNLSLDCNAVFNAAFAVGDTAVTAVRAIGSAARTWSGADAIMLSATDVFIDATDSAGANTTLTIANALTCKNLYFFRGNLVAEHQTLTVLQDFAAWGARYSPDDPRFAGSDTRFAYYPATTAGGGLSYYPAGEVPADKAIRERTTAAVFASLAGTTIAVGKNLYLNGVDVADATFVLQDTAEAQPQFNSSATVTEAQWGTPYAVAFNMTATNVTATGSWIAASQTAQNVTDGGANTQWQFAHPQIASAYTVYDDVIALTFTLALENSHDEISSGIRAYAGGTVATGGVWYNDRSLSFADAYADPDCTTALHGDVAAGTPIYLRTTNGSWNTDATGTSAGDAQSSDRTGAHQTRIPDLALLEGLLSAADGHTMSANYGTGLEWNGSAYAVPARYTDATDNCAPVLIAAYTGQELHTAHDGTAESQPYYDAHNFIEFQYSEAVDIGDLLADAGDLNALASEAVSAADHGGHITNNANGFTVAGLATFANGSVVAGNKANATDSPHALYRTFALAAGGAVQAQTHRVRVSVAGYVDGTVSAPVGTSPTRLADYRNWVGYIDAATAPSGTVTPATNAYVLDASGNAIDATGAENHALPAVTVNAFPASVTAPAAAHTLYGAWDTTPPSFARYVDGVNDDFQWVGKDDERATYEIIGTVENDVYLQNVEFHLFDNKPAYTADETYKWLARYGWMQGTSVIDGGATPDIVGGARDFLPTAANHTTGGIRRSSLAGAAAAFTYRYHLDGHDSDDRLFNTDESAAPILQGMRSALFRQEDALTTDTYDDGLYFSLFVHPDDSGRLPIRTRFVITYTPSDCYITDLAGNRLLHTDNGHEKVLNSIDVTPPAFALTLSPVADNKLYVTFTKQLSDERGHPLENGGAYLNELAQEFEFIPRGDSETDTTETITVTEVELVKITQDYTILLLTLDQNVTLDNLEQLWLRTKKIDDARHKATNSLSGSVEYATLIRDSIGNYMEAHTCHTFSDFALNAVNVLYAYTPNLLDEVTGEPIEKNLYAATEGNDYAVHDFSATAGNYGRLHAGKDITLQVQFVGGKDENGFFAPVNGETMTLIPDLASHIQPSWKSDAYNDFIGADWRLWLTTQFDFMATGYNDSPLASPSAPASVGDNAGLLWNFSLPQETYGFSAGDEVQFIFTVCDSAGTALTIDHDADNGRDTDELPLYALWMPNIGANIVPFVDLWSFRLSDTKKQRGGVSILNNVINVSVKEQTVIQVDMPEDGNLNVYVMTLEGNIVQRLEHGHVSAGTHFYRWNGTNRAGNSVARGMYFVRVVGSGIDETRKVLCVKN